MSGGAALAFSLFCLAIDGDTLVCRQGMERVHLRLNGIDAPEIHACRKGRKCASGDPLASKANLARMIAGKRVHWVDLGRDRYGRTIAQAKVGNRDLQCAQLRGGFAIYRGDWDNQKLTRKRCRP